MTTSTTTTNERDQATARVRAALDAGNSPDDADLMICDAGLLRRAQEQCRERDPLTAAMVDTALPRREALS